MSSICDKNIFKNGTPLCAVDTGPVGGADKFEEYIVGIRHWTNAQVDWHYSGGRAQVLVLGDMTPVKEEILKTPLPPGMMILRWFEPGQGLWRNFNRE